MLYNLKDNFIGNNVVELIFLIFKLTKIFLKLIETNRCDKIVLATILTLNLFYQNSTFFNLDLGKSKFNFLHITKIQPDKYIEEPLFLLLLQKFSLKIFHSTLL